MALHRRGMIVAFDIGTRHHKAHAVHVDGNNVEEVRPFLGNLSSNTLDARISPKASPKKLASTMIKGIVACEVRGAATGLVHDYVSVHLSMITVVPISGGSTRDIYYDQHILKGTISLLFEKLNKNAIWLEAVAFTLPVSVAADQRKRFKAIAEAVVNQHVELHPPEPGRKPVVIVVPESVAGFHHEFKNVPAGTRGVLVDGGKLANHQVLSDKLSSEEVQSSEWWHKVHSLPQGENEHTSMVHDLQAYTEGGIVTASGVAEGSNEVVGSDEGQYGRDILHKAFNLTADAVHGACEKTLVPLVKTELKRALQLNKCCNYNPPVIVKLIGGGAALPGVLKAVQDTFRE
eukprot:gene9464-9629_t